ncbi:MULTISPECIES: hypothetical protein [Actinomadura]|uniref:Tn3 transposase DDE domain-containing protein n=1 Tax=Actinomadura madurae TaxID=1993 RepID=A0A1I5XI25_9ACTN|nr:hypothetical protein [Actinomadura madurae]SFQ31456.1 hypothetical protein SAMN04489713_1276 [Actinomadura madurae]
MSPRDAGAGRAVICWTTEYYSLAIDELRGQGRDIRDELCQKRFGSPAFDRRLRQARGGDLAGWHASSGRLKYAPTMRQW